MSENEKEEYKRRAKTQPTQPTRVQRAENPRKYTTHGILISDVERDMMNKEEARIKADKKVKDLITNAFVDNGK